MEAQVQQLITDLNGKQPTRADVIRLLELLVGTADKMPWVEMFGNATNPKLIDDIKSYSLFYEES